MNNPKTESENIIDKAYTLIEEGDTLISITERGLNVAITDALISQAKRYMEMIESLGYELGRIEDALKHKWGTNDGVDNAIYCAEKTLSQLAEFKKGMEGK